MDVLDEIESLIAAKKGSENSLMRRTRQIKWLWAFTGFFMSTVMAWVVIGTLWYAKMDRTARAVEQIYLKVFGNPMP